jgi:tetratricopeptide (TPR) repeat protein
MVAMSYLGQVYMNLGRFEDTLAICKEQYGLAMETFGPNHRETLTILYNLSAVYIRKGDRDNAITHLTLYVEKATLLDGANDSHVLEASKALAKLRLGKLGNL